MASSAYFNVTVGLILGVFAWFILGGNLQSTTSSGAGENTTPADSTWSAMEIFDLVIFVFAVAILILLVISCFLWFYFQVLNCVQCFKLVKEQDRMWHSTYRKDFIYSRRQTPLQTTFDTEFETNYTAHETSKRKPAKALGTTTATQTEDRHFKIQDTVSTAIESDSRQRRLLSPQKKLVKLFPKDLKKDSGQRRPCSTPEKLFKSGHDDLTKDIRQRRPYPASPKLAYPVHDEFGYAVPSTSKGPVTFLLPGGVCFNPNSTEIDEE